jgi:hypothetical protein
MASRSGRRPGRTKRVLERVILGSLMSVGAYLVERRLRRALRRSGAGKRPRRTVRLS